MTHIEWGALILALFLGLPVLVYVCTKLGTHAHLRAKREFQDREGENSDTRT